jgi:MFS family permease
MGTDMGFMIGPTLSGILVANFGYSNMYRIMIIPIVIASALFIILYPKIKAISAK